MKKLQQTLETTRKSSNGTKKPNELASAEAGSGHVAADGLINYEIQRLTNEIAMLKEANKTKEEKTQVYIYCLYMYMLSINMYKACMHAAV